MSERPKCAKCEKDIVGKACGIGQAFGRRVVISSALVSGRFRRRRLLPPRLLLLRQVDVVGPPICRKMSLRTFGSSSRR